VKAVGAQINGGQRVWVGCLVQWILHVKRVSALFPRPWGGATGNWLLSPERSPHGAGSTAAAAHRAVRVPPGAFRIPPVINVLHEGAGIPGVREAAPTAAIRL
jgi:hypothetical protein